MILENAKIYTMNENADIIKNGYIEIEDGKIVAVGEGKSGKDGAVDLGGASVYPGFIDAHTHMGLFNSGCGVEGEDFNEDSDPVTPQLSVIDAINPIDRSFEDALYSGITAVTVAPGSTNPIAGKVYTISTYGKRIDNMILCQSGIKFALGENPKMTYMNKEEAPVTRMATAALIKEALSKAKRYMADKERAFMDNEIDEPEYDAKNEALIPLLKGDIKAHFHCHRADDIFTAIRIAKEFDLKYNLVHCTEGHIIADELAKENSDFVAITGPIISDRCKPELAKLTTQNSAILRENNIDVAICTDHGEVPIHYLTLSAAIAVKAGMSEYDAIKAITITAAKAAGIDDVAGSVEISKRADLVIFENSPFDVMSQPLMVIAGGNVIDCKHSKVWREYNA